MLVSAQHALGDDPRVGAFVAADEAERDIGGAVSGFSSAIVRGTSSVRISPSVTVVFVFGFLNRLRAASASSMMRRASA